ARGADGGRQPGAARRQPLLGVLFEQDPFTQLQLVVILIPGVRRLEADLGADELRAGGAAVLFEPVGVDEPPGVVVRVVVDAPEQGGLVTCGLAHALTPRAVNRDRSPLAFLSCTSGEGQGGMRMRRGGSLGMGIGSGRWRHPPALPILPPTIIRTLRAPSPMVAAN